MVLLGMVGVFLIGMGPSADGQIGTPAQNPLSGSIAVTGTVPGPAPTTQARILTPVNGSTVTNLPGTVSGICKAGLVISIYSNGIFIGSTVCSTGGSFNLPVNLFVGTNILIARVSDALGQYGPDSDAVTVTYSSPTLNLPSGVAAARQFFLTTDSPSRGGTPTNALTASVTIVGGFAPYALNVDWGDGSTQLVSRQFDGALALSHTYAQAGVYHVTITGTDGSGNSALLQIVTVINGPVAVTGASTNNGPTILVSVWPLYVLASLFVFMFYLGERRELHKLRRRHQLISGF
jgi:hypothetical protein